MLMSLPISLVPLHSEICVMVLQLFVGLQSTRNTHEVHKSLLCNVSEQKLL